MRNPFKRKTNPLKAEHDRLVRWLSATDPNDNEYETVTKRLNDLNRILNRASESKKAWIPALGTVGAVGGIYAIQQFGGVLVPKAMESLAARQEAKQNPKELD